MVAGGNRRKKRGRPSGADSPGAADSRGSADSPGGTDRPDHATGGSGWTGLAPVYDRLFPPGPAQLDFITTVLARTPYPARFVLDIGCATGGYTVALADRGFSVTCIDLDAEMIRLAGLKAQDRAAAAAAEDRLWPAPHFLVRDMTDLGRLPGGRSEGRESGEALFDGVICLGNTLAHLLSAAELSTAVGEMARVLSANGRAILQTVNYDRLRAAGEFRFAPLTARTGEGEELIFRRLYLPKADGLVNFVTTLEESRTGRMVLRAETLLRPTVMEELVTIARMAFHGEVRVYGDFLFSEWNEGAPATVVIATRGEE